MSWFSPQSNKADAKSLSRGAGYALGGGRQRAQGVNDVIDAAGGK